MLLKPSAQNSQCPWARSAKGQLYEETGEYTGDVEVMITERANLETYFISEAQSERRIGLVDFRPSFKLETILTKLCKPDCRLSLWGYLV